MVGYSTMILPDQPATSSPYAARIVRLFVRLSTKPRLSFVNQTVSLTSPSAIFSSVPFLILSLISFLRSSALKKRDSSYLDASRTITSSCMLRLDRQLGRQPIGTAAF